MTERPRFDGRHCQFCGIEYVATPIYTGELFVRYLICCPKCKGYSCALLDEPRNWAGSYKIQKVAGVPR